MSKVAQQASAKAITTLISKVQPSYKVAHDLVQEAAVAIVDHAMKYGDCTLALTLVRTIPINQARSLIQYFMAVSPIGVLLSKSKANDKVRLIKQESAAYNPFDMDKAKALSWWTMDAAQAEKEAIEVSSGGVFDTIIKSMSAIIKNDSATKTYTDDAINAAKAIKDAVAKVRAAQLAAMSASTETAPVLPVEMEAAAA